MNIGSRLKQILEEQNMTVSRLSREAGVSAQTIYAMIKRDSNKADMDIMARILNALDMDLMEFLQIQPRKKGKISDRKSGEAALAEPVPEEMPEPEAMPEPEEIVEPEEIPEPEELSEPEEIAEPEEIPEPEEEVRYRRREIEDYLL